MTDSNASDAAADGSAASLGSQPDEHEWDDVDFDNHHAIDCDCVECTFEFHASQCGRLPQHLGGGCTMAGTEFCDFDCPFSWL